MSIEKSVKFVAVTTTYVEKTRLRRPLLSLVDGDFIHSNQQVGG
jgi:hypothetical protein